MKKAVIATGGKQYLVAVGDVLDIELVSTDKTLQFEPLLTIDGDAVQVGTPNLSSKVTAEVVAANVKDDKVTAIRYKSKKRVHKVRGHRQQHTQIKIKTIA